ncbi:HalOD1 output domain-containing protein [Natrinema sp. HArc-T2]|uniref:HalOD1 output domain-containing protein n=1 Tax=Natrinema sp. HArc-T2 TaxID=3242701 RepID=UPI00359D7DD3
MTLHTTPNSSTIVLQIIETVAAADNTDPATMNPPLADVIDPDALQELLEHGSTDADRALEVRFRYRGHEITVTDDETVELD